MSDGKLSTPDQYECAVVLSEYQDVIKVAYLGSFAGVHTKSKAKRIDTVIGLDGVLNADQTICADLRRTIDAVLNGRELASVTIDDLKRIASCSPDWLRTERLSAPWVSAAYHTRNMAYASEWG